MKSFWTPEAAVAVAQLAAGPALLAFDFDGTLAPIVADPAAAQVHPDTARRLARLARLRPVAIVTGRDPGDVPARLGFTPACIVGHHGAQPPSDAVRRAWRAALAPLRAETRLHAAELRAAGVVVEDKGLSLALHYRHAADPNVARAAIDGVVAAGAAALHRFGGKCVENFVAPQAPNKGDAVERLRQEWGAEGVLFIGDDINDESVFSRATERWVTVRVGHDDQSAARFWLHDQGELPQLLDLLLERLT